jgi:hypothetical protein
MEFYRLRPFYARCFSLSSSKRPLATNTVCVRSMYGARFVAALMLLEKMLFGFHDLHVCWLAGLKSVFVCQQQRCTQ